MQRKDRVVLVAGATGHQGGASTRHLLADGWHVRALTRHPDSPAARQLASLGAELVRGDLLDRASIDEAVRGAYGVHSVETFREAGPEGEMTEGRNLADAAKAAGVRHFVYDSVIGADEEHPRQPWVVTKRALEQYVRDIRLPWTIIRPTTFMENFLGQKDALAEGVFRRMEPPDEPHDYIAVDDIGRFVALAFSDPDVWIGTATLIAGDELTGEEAAVVLGRVLGHEVRYEQTQQQGMPSGPPHLADIPRLRALLPGLKTLDAWARTIDWAPAPASARR